METFIVIVICILLGFILGYIAFTVNSMTQKDTSSSKHHRKPHLKITRYWVGNEEFNVSLFRVKNFCDEMEDTPNGCKVMGQIYHIRQLTKSIVGLIIGYDLKWFENEKLDDVIQAEIDLFVKNLERFNHFLQQPPVVVQSGIDEAIAELKTANQTIMDQMGSIKNSVTDYIEKGGYKLIEFNQ